jgi:hypothetical protein
MTTSSDLQTVRSPANTSAQAKPWWVYLPDFGRDAQEWCEAYEQFGTGISKRVTLVVRDLQRRKLECALRELEGCRVDVEAVMSRAPRPVATVVEISYLSTLAYYHYHIGEFDTAREVLARAVSLIEETISLAPFLVPCAGQCYDYRLHLARIARAESRWDEMFEQIRIGRGMVHGEFPLCHTVRGPVYLKDVCAFYGKARPLNEVERETLQLLSDQRTVQREYHNLCLAATVVPFIVVNWLGH